MATQHTESLGDLTTADLRQAQELSDNPEANSDPHFLLLGRLGVGKSTFAGRITGGRIQGSSGPTGGTTISRESPGQWRYVKTELIEEGNTGQRYYVHDTVGLGDRRVNLEEMKREINEIGGSCCVFLCFSWDEREHSQDMHTIFEICNSLNKWKDVIFVITKCDLANVDDTFKSQWKNVIKDKLMFSMGVNEEVAEDIATKQIVYSGYQYPQLRSKLIDAIKNIIAKGLDQHRMKCLSLGKALIILDIKLKAMEEEELQRQCSTEIGDSGIRRRRHEENSRHSDMRPPPPPPPTSPPSSSLSANDVLSMIAKYIAGVGAIGIGGTVLVCSASAYISLGETITASAVGSGTTFTVTLASGAIVTISLGAIIVLYLTGKLLFKFFS